MNNRQQILFLIQVAIPFALIGLVHSRYFYIPAALIVISLPSISARQTIIKHWMNLGIFMGKIISPVVLSIIYYLGLTPLALIRKFLGSDELHLKKPPVSNLKTVSESVSPERFDDLW